MQCIIGQNFGGDRRRAGDNAVKRSRNGMIPCADESKAESAVRLSTYYTSSVSAKLVGSIIGIRSLGPYSKQRLGHADLFPNLAR